MTRSRRRSNEEHVCAGEKLATLDLDKRLNVVDVMYATVRENLAKVRITLARLRSIKTASSASLLCSSTSLASCSQGDKIYQPYLEKLKHPVFSGMMENWPEF